MKNLKPYDLVVAKQTIEGVDCSYCGEVISLPVDGSVMVRQVPNNPATMVEIPTRLLEKTNYYNWVHYATVHGRGSFPVDMLRYDFATPVNFIVEPSQQGPMAQSEQDSFIIARCTQYKNDRAWTTARWSSFSWCIEPTKTVKILRGA